MPYPILKYIFTSTFSFFIATICFGHQLDTTKGKVFHISPPLKGSALDSIDRLLQHGDKNALLKLAPYLDSAKTLSEFLGYHHLQTPEKSIAQRLINENCIFLDSELKVTDNTTADKFLSFLKQSQNKIVFDNDAKAFLITPLVDREVKYELRSLSSPKKKELDNRQLGTDIWNGMYENKIEQLIKDGNPRALYEIAAKLYQGRTRFNRYQNDINEYIGFLELLTATEFGFENELNKITFQIDKNFSDVPRLNLLIYFARNYSSYHWDKNLGLFVNPDIKLEQANKETIDFQLLKSKTDSVAFNAFIELTRGDPEKVNKIADDYKKSETIADANNSLPMFPYNFLKQLSFLTQYCRKNNIDFVGSKFLHESINQLKKEQPFVSRRSLEDKVIQAMTLDDVTAFEYWCMIYEENWDLTYSAGRILDKFYSAHWEQLVSNKKQLELYLNKSKLYGDVGIIGICDGYLTKFQNADSATMNMLRHYSSSDDGIQKQAAKALSIAMTRPKLTKVNKVDDGNYDAKPFDLKGEFSRAMTKDRRQENRDSIVVNMLSRIRYQQIGLALDILKTYNFKKDSHIDEYDFLKRDFGFFNTDFYDINQRQEFISYYNSHSEEQLYAHYLHVAGIDCQNKNGSLNYDKIYELLKYDVVTAFVGGGGGKNDNEVYSLIKLLELKFKTTLGFPSKLCNSDNMYYCDSSSRVNEWICYLKENHLLKRAHNGPISFYYK